MDYRLGGQEGNIPMIAQSMTCLRDDYFQEKLLWKEGLVDDGLRSLGQLLKVDEV